jgi:cytochrome c oxidase subunit 2
VAEETRIADAKAAEQELLAMNMDMSELMANGERTYIAYCAACHQPNGAGLPGIFPTLAGSALILNDKLAHIDIVLNGKSGTAMQAFGRQLSLKELASVLTYTRNAWGNDTGDAIQAADVFKVQQGEGE